MSRQNQTPEPLPIIFICYRRAETEAYAARVRDALKSHFGRRARIFWDYDDIPPAVDFVEAIKDAIGASVALVAIIGRQWASVRDEETGRPRLENDKDHVRAEVVSALKAGVRVIPLLVQDAQMPGETHLPDDLKPLATINALELSFKRWEYDSQQLITVLEGALPPEKPRWEPHFYNNLVVRLRTSYGRSSWLWSSAAIVLVTIAAASVFFITWQPLSNKPPNVVPTPTVTPSPNTKHLDTGEFPLVSLIGIGQVSREFEEKVIRVAIELETDPNYLMAVMSFETAGKFSPSVQDPLTKGTGLVQLMPAEAEALGTSVEALSKMTAVEQLDYVAKFYAPYKGRLQTVEDAYMVRFYPEAVGKSGNDVIYRKPESSYSQNQLLDANGDGAITVYEAADKVRSRLSAEAGSGDLSRGMTGPEVGALQDKMIELGHLLPAGKATGPGIFGPMLNQALTDFQELNGLPTNGVYDAPTKDVVRQLLGGVRKGSRGRAVHGLKRLLAKLGCLTNVRSSADQDTFDDVVESALKQCQEVSDIEASGVLTKETYKRLLSLVPNP
jgi:peptidoglycan hydrolase-like protein with peptidoglycan-binding domain